MIGAVEHIKSVTIGDFTGTVTVFNSVGSTVTANATDIVRPSDWNSNHNFDGTILGNTSGGSTYSNATALYLAGGSNVTLALTTGAGAATISVNVNTAATISMYAPQQLDNNTVFTSPAQNTLYLQPFIPVADQVIASQLNVPMLVSYTSSSAGSKSYSNTWSICLYSQGTGGNSTQLGSLTSVSGSFGATRFSTGVNITIAVNGNSTTTTGSSALAGVYIMQAPLNVTLSGGQLYYLGVANSTATAGTSAGLGVSFLAMTDINSNMGKIGTNAGLSATNSSNFLGFDPVFFSATSGAWPSTIGSNALTRNVSGGEIYVEFVNQSIF